MSDLADVRENWARYLHRRMGVRRQADFAKLAGVTDGQLSKWRSGTGGVKAETVIAVARALGDSPLHALTEVGYLDAAEIGPFQAPREWGLSDYTDQELSAEILRRIQQGSAGAALTDPIEIEDTTEPGSNITHLRPKSPVGGSTEDLAEVASESIRHDPDDTDDKYDA
ncbi:helix-turn-helix domain-containing protein [Streptomyces albidoflavus]